MVDPRDVTRLTSLCLEMVRRVDNGEAATVHELFMVDGVLELNPGHPMTGEQAIRTWGQQRDLKGGISIHTCSNFLFVGEAAGPIHGESLVCTYSKPSDHDDVAQFVGRYDDTFRLVDGRWLFASRHYRTLLSFSPGLAT